MKYVRTLLLAVGAFAMSVITVHGTYDLVIDPGHGGPGADMYCNGGGHNNYNGSSGPVHVTSRPALR